MSIHSDRSERLAEMEDRLPGVDHASADLISAVAAAICRDAPGAPAPIRQLIAAGAWTDAVLALLAHRLPQWQLRRLDYDEGEWHCALSCQRELPEWLDQAIEVSHPDLVLALCEALLQAARQPRPKAATPAAAPPSVTTGQCDLICCDNFV
jgi:hypothetical protein